MEHDAETLQLEVRLLIEAIHAKYGYDLRGHKPAVLHRRVMAVLAKFGLPHLGELQHRVLHEPDLFLEVMEQLTIRVTEMFRDPNFFLAFRREVTPLLRTYPLLRIWHAGCSTGEEVYGCAIVMSEAGLYDRCQLYATDLSLSALEHAKDGVYPLERATLFAANYEESGGTGRFLDHCTEAYGRIAMREELRRNILFFQHDLVSDQVFGEMHVVFCRNVLIYFDKELRQRVLGKFRESLRSGGVLCLGASERLLREDEIRFGFHELAPGARIYQRSG